MHCRFTYKKDYPIFPLLVAKVPGRSRGKKSADQTIELTPVSNSDFQRRLSAKYLQINGRDFTLILSQ